MADRLRPLQRYLYLDEAKFWERVQREADSLVEMPTAMRLPVALQFAGSPAIYVPGGNVIVMNSDNAAAQDIAWNAAEIARYRQIQLFHEMVHAWQYQNFGEQLRVAKATLTVKQAVLKGHAEYAACLYCATQHWDQLYDRMSAVRNRMRTVPLPEGVRGRLLQLCRGASVLSILPR